MLVLRPSFIVLSYVDVLPRHFLLADVFELQVRSEIQGSYATPG
jgi:hypothetical protein